MKRNAQRCLSCLEEFLGRRNASSSTPYEVLQIQTQSLESSKNRKSGSFIVPYVSRAHKDSIFIVAKGLTV